jgi:hypothetical protein
MTLNDEIKLFAHRELKAKDVFYIKEITKTEAYDFVSKYHYLGDAKFFCEQAFGLFAIHGDNLLGVATFSQPQGNVALKGWFGLTNQDKCVYELSRLCMSPSLNRTNATSYLLGGSIKELKKQRKIKAVITLADSHRHVGSIYQVCNFKYYGLTAVKSDFYSSDGKVNPRGATKDKHGVWLPRSRKHRYAYVIDNKLKVLYEECHKPNVDATEDVDCCHGTHKVYDNRFHEWYTCPRCTGSLKFIEKDVESVNV